MYIWTGKYRHKLSIEESVMGIKFYYGTSASLVQRIGEGQIVGVVNDNQGKIKQLAVELLPTH